MLTKVLAQELKPYDIMVNALCPGATETGLLQTIISTQRGDYSHAAKPQEVAKCVTLLSSDLAEDITGKIFDGPPRANVEGLRKTLQKQRHHP